MQPIAGQMAQLVDAERRPLGRVQIEQSEGGLVSGKFDPSPGFLSVESLFRAFEEAVDSQALSVVDELDAVIAALGLHLLSADGSQCLKVHDVQIWSDGGISFRLSGSDAVSVNGSSTLSQPAQPAPEK